MISLAREAVENQLTRWLTANVGGWRDVSVRMLDVDTGTGFSADIFFIDVHYVDDAGVHDRVLVVRRQPSDLEVVHGSSLALQGQAMAALDREGSVPVPPWIGMELDPSVLGMPFLIMAKVEGQSAKQKPNYNVEGWLVAMTPENRATTWRNGIHAFARLAALDWRNGFDFLADPANGAAGLDQYVGQLETWHRAAGKGRDMPIVDTAIRYVRERMPDRAPVNVLWGDPTPSNILFNERGGVNALIDWELAALGPAELDLAWWLYFDDLFGPRFGVQRLEGLPTREQSVAIWEEAVGRPARDLDYYDIVAALRMALVAIGAFDRQVGLGNIPPENKSLNANFMTLYLAERLGMEKPDLGPDFYAFMKNLTPVEEK